jgi:hypothetical protein
MSEPSIENSAVKGRRLDSWKEIAAYLNRDVTTVQRWEKREGMPVCRHLHAKRGSVYAVQGELDAWLEQRRSRKDIQPENETAVSVRQEKREKYGRRGVWWWVVLGLAVVALAAGYFVWRASRRGSVAMPIRSLTVLPLENLSGDGLEIAKKV